MSYVCIHLPKSQKGVGELYYLEGRYLQTIIYVEVRLNDKAVDLTRMMGLMRAVLKVMSCSF